MFHLPFFSFSSNLLSKIIGPAFNIDAYNYGVTGNEKSGIRSQNKRGVLSMDQQYNAFNFVYYVLRSNNSYERKVSKKKKREGKRTDTRGETGEDGEEKDKKE